MSISQVLYYYRKKRGAVSRILGHHGIVAWMVVVGLTILFWRTRASLLSEIGQLKEFSSASESETFEKMSKMNENIAAKNRDISELNKSQRSLQKSMKRCEDEKASLTHERDSVTLKVEQLATELADSRKQAEKYRQECHEVVQAKDTAHVEKDAIIQQLQDEIKNISERIKKTEKNSVGKDDQGGTGADGNSKHDEESERKEVESSGRQQQVEQQTVTSNEGADKMDTQGSVRITENSNNRDDPVQEEESLKQKRKGRKKNLGMLKEHMGMERNNN